MKNTLPKADEFVQKNRFGYYGNNPKLSPSLQNSINSTVSNLPAPLQFDNSFEPYQAVDNAVSTVANDATLRPIPAKLPPIPTANQFKNNISLSQDDVFNHVFYKSVIGEEGGYEDNPKKIDAPTNMGIRQDTLQRFKKAHSELSQGYPINVRDLSYEQAKQIAKIDYFDAYRIGEIKNNRLQETIFDALFNHSPWAPALWVQKSLNQNSSKKVKEDGILGSESINALNSLSSDEIVKVNNAILDQRFADHQRELKTNKNPNYESYTVGIPNRIKRFRIK